MVVQTGKRARLETGLLDSASANNNVRRPAHADLSNRYIRADLGATSCSQISLEDESARPISRNLAEQPTSDLSLELKWSQQGLSHRAAEVATIAIARW